MPSFGETLRRERELRHISLREISESTKINHRYLEALERDDFRHLPGGVFNKGFVRAYAQFIGIDPEAMVNAYLDEEQRQVARDATRADEPMRRAALAEQEAGREQTRQRRGVAAALVVAVVLVVAVAAAAVWAWRSGRLAFLHLPGPSSTVGGPETTPATESAGATASAPAPLTPLGRPALPEPAPDVPPAPPLVTLSLARATTGWVRCGGQEPHKLDGLAAGAQISFGCAEPVTFDVADAGALRYAFGPDEPRAVGLDGSPSSGRLEDKP